MVYPTQALNAAFTEPAPAYPTGTGADGGLTSTEQYHHDLAVADWTTRKKASKDVHDASTAQNMYLFNLLVAAISDTVRAKIATEVANSAEGSVIRTAQTTLGSKLDGPQFLALLKLAYAPHSPAELEREQEELLHSLATVRQSHSTPIHVHFATFRKHLEDLKLFEAGDPTLAAISKLTQLWRDS